MVRVTTGKRKKKYRKEIILGPFPIYDEILWVSLAAKITCIYYES